MTISTATPRWTRASTTTRPKFTPVTTSALTLRDRVAIHIGWVAGFTARRLRRGKGVQIAGRVIELISPTILERLAANRSIVLVSATNGKTTITAMLSQALVANGHAVATNTTGANLRQGVVQAFVADLDATIAVLEIDEAALNQTLDVLQPTLIVLGELSRDQLDRHHEVRAVALRWKTTFARTRPPIIAPSNDPNVVWSVGDLPATWIDLEATSTLDAASCPECTRLIHEDKAARDWWCECGLRRPQAVGFQRGAEVALATGTFDCSSSLLGPWQRANAALAIAALEQLGENTERARAALRAVNRVGERPTALQLADGRSARFVMTKNPASWIVLLDELASTKDSVVVSQNDESPDGRDPSWLWDVPFERLAPRAVAASGSRALDVATRLEAAGLEVVVVEADARKAAALLPNEAAVVIGASYSAFHQLIEKRDSVRG